MAESDSPGVISAAEPVAKVAPVLLEEEAGFISPTAGDLPSMAGLHGKIATTFSNYGWDDIADLQQA